jgi:cytochrome c peroxidase
LSGAHDLGRCHSDRSGFEGKWVNNPTRYSSTYVRLLMMHDWKRKRLENGMEQCGYVDADLGEELMML